VNFLYPLFTLAGLAVLIPILIHLFNFRRYKKVFFPDIRFLKELQEQTRKHSQLKHLLILASRILAVLSLVFAFAQPFLTKDRDQVTQGPKAVSIYLDNSFSMGIEQNSLSLLDLAKGKAKDIIQGLGSNDRIQLLSNDFAYNENRFLSKDEALRQLSTIQVSPRNRSAQTILEKQKQLLQTEPGLKKQQVYISDFQKNSFPTGLESTDSIKKFFVPVKASAIQNVSIDTAYFETPSILLNETNPLVVQLKNHSDEEVSTSISVMVNRQLKSVANTTLKAGESKAETISFTTSTAGNQQIQLFINDYPVSFDDTFYVAGKVSSNYAVLVINQASANAFLSSVFRPGTQFRVDNSQVASVNIANLKNYSLIILNGTNQMSPALIEALSDFVLNGGSMLVFAPQGNDAGDLNDLLGKTAGCNYLQTDTAKLSVTSYNKSHDVFRDIFSKTPENIDLPVVYKRFIISSSALSSEQKLFSFSNSDAFLSSYKTGNGKLYVCASSAEMSASTFPKSYWFLPMIYKMAYLNASDAIHAITLGRNASVFIENSKTGDKAIYHIKQNEFDAIPEQRAIANRVQINFNQAAQVAGLYAVYLPGSKDSTFVGLNYDRAESDLRYWDINELKNASRIPNAEWFAADLNISGSVNALQQGFPLWKVCIILALLFLLTEILLIRFMR
jgi:hypothetical protein